MQKLRNALVALVIAVALTWMPAFAVGSAQANEYHPGLQFAIEPGTGDFVEFQSGPIFSPDHEVHVYYDSLRVAQPANPDCSPFKDLAEVKGYVMSDNSGDFKTFDLVSLDPPAIDYIKFGSFKTPSCYQGSEEIQIWFQGFDQEGNKCFDSDFSNNYKFPVICE
ncbi:MAG: hypothetical protein F6K31_11135 [Symploca sp. SIO2G7]|nr:hypothetical protein [Symploca sp. SIO2G7]